MMTGPFTCAHMEKRRKSVKGPLCSFPLTTLPCPSLDFLAALCKFGFGIPEQQQACTSLWRSLPAHPATRALHATPWMNTRTVRKMVAQQRAQQLSSERRFVLFLFQTTKKKEIVQSMSCDWRGMNWPKMFFTSSSLLGLPVTKVSGRPPSANLFMD